MITETIKKEDPKDVLRNKVLNFAEIATEGCDRTVCLREFCRKNPGRYYLMSRYERAG